jgi:hypothetical protein
MVTKFVTGFGIGTSVLRSPIRLGVAPGHSKPFHPEEWKRLEKLRKVVLSDELEREDTDRNNQPLGFETFEEMKKQRSVVVVTVSGGGTRAAILGLSALAELEREYNRIRGCEAGCGGGDNANGPDEEHTPNQSGCSSKRSEPKPLIDLIDIFSSVSGGSILAYVGATDRQRVGNGLCGRTFFQDLETRRGDDLARIGVNPSLAAFLGLPFFFASDVTYADLLARGIAADAEGGGQPSLDMQETTRGQVRPLFLFNTTSLEAARPVILTQRIVNLTSEEMGRQEIDLGGGSSLRTRSPTVARPLYRGITLEELGIDPMRFPLPVAAAASAAFPLGIEPVVLHRFGYDADGEHYETSQRLRVTDGGVLDNSGLSSATDLIEYLTAQEIHAKHPSKVRRAVVIELNADVDHYESPAVEPIPEPAEWWNRLGDIVRIGSGCLYIPLPVRCEAAGFTAIEQIHARNKMSSIALARERLLRLAERRDAVELEYYRVALSDLFPGSDVRFRVTPGKSVVERVRAVATHLAISQADQRVIASASDELLHADRQVGWPVGPICPAFGEPREVEQVAKAAAFSLRTTDEERKDSGEGANSTATQTEVRDPCPPIRVKTVLGNERNLGSFTVNWCRARTCDATADSQRRSPELSRPRVIEVSDPCINDAFQFEFSIPEIPPYDDLELVTVLEPIQSKPIPRERRQRAVEHTFSGRVLAQSGNGPIKLSDPYSCGCEDEEWLTEIPRHWRFTLKNEGRIIAEREFHFRFSGSPQKERECGPTACIDKGACRGLLRSL